MWNFFDKIYCINLYSRDDRLERCKKLFQRLKIPVTFYRVHKHPTSGAQGCYESHLSIIKDAYDNNYNNILIFEDDIIESPSFSEEIIERGIDFMKKDRSWDIFYLGHQPDIFYTVSRSIENNIIKTSSTLTHAYAISRRFMEKMLNIPYFGVAIDKIYSQNSNSYALYPMAFYQDETLVSDIPTSAPIRGWRFTEIYAKYVGYPVFYLVTLLIFLLFIIVIFIYLRRFFKSSSFS